MARTIRLLSLILAVAPLAAAQEGAAALEEAVAKRIAHREELYAKKE